MKKWWRHTETFPLFPVDFIIKNNLNKFHFQPLFFKYLFVLIFSQYFKVPALDYDGIDSLNQF